MSDANVIVFLSRAGEALSRTPEEMRALFLGGFKPLLEIARTRGCTTYFRLVDLERLRDAIANDPELEADANLTILYVYLT